MTAEMYFVWMATRFPHTFWYLFGNSGGRGNGAAAVALCRARHLFRDLHANASAYGREENRNKEINELFDSGNPRELSILSGNIIYFSAEIPELGELEKILGAVSHERERAREALARRKGLLEDLRTVTKPGWFNIIFERELKSRGEAKRREEFVFDYFSGCYVSRKTGKPFSGVPMLHRAAWRLLFDRLCRFFKTKREDEESERAKSRR